MENLTIMEYQNKRVLTSQQLADVYETEPNNISKNFTNNKERFIEGKDYYLLQGTDLKEFKRVLNNIPDPIKFTSILYLWTERGANRHCKILGTDKAWEQFDVLEENYFKTKNQAPMCLEDVLVSNILALKEVRIQGEQNAAAIKQLDVSVEKHDAAINNLNAKLTTIQTNYYTIAGYASLTGVKVSTARAKQLGFMASALSRQQGIEIGKEYNAQYGQVNSYHSDILEEVFSKQ